MNDEEQWVEDVRRGYSPPELSPAEAAAFDAGLEARLGPRRPLWLLAPALAVAVAAVLFLAWPRGEAPAPTPPPVALVSVDAFVDALDPHEALGDEAWADLEVDVEDDEALEDVSLPDEYLALAEVLAPLEDEDPLEVFR